MIKSLEVRTTDKDVNWLMELNKKYIHQTEQYYYYNYTTFVIHKNNRNGSNSVTAYKKSMKHQPRCSKLQLCCTQEQLSL